MLIPCKDYCYLRFGKQYTEKCDNACDYARVVKVLKEVLTSIDPCTVTCKKSYYQAGVPWDCDHLGKDCQKCSMYEIDWNKVYNEYNIKL